MIIPDNCNAWAAQLALGSSGDRRALQNITDENCLPSLESRFFSEVANRGNPNTPDQARDFAEQIVNGGPATYMFQGSPIPVGLFTTVLRFQRCSSLWWGLSRDYLMARGVTASQLDTMADNEIAILCDEYSGTVKLGGHSGIVWVTDEKQASGLSPRTLIDRLGLAGWDLETRAIQISIARAQLPELKVPRAFDGIANDQFLLEPSCSAAHGTTLPLTLGLPGLPEAVYSPADVPNVRLSLVFVS